MKSIKISKNTASEGEMCNERKVSFLHLLIQKGLFYIKYTKYVIIYPFEDAIIVYQGWCSGERNVVLHVPYLEMSDRDQMSSTFT